MGYPLSPLLFAIAVEALAMEIRLVKNNSTHPNKK